MHGTHDEHCTCGCGGHTHTHEHSHDHEHHDHHEGCGCGCGCGGHEQQDENTAILTYMLDHNKHHALELKEIAKHLREVGKDDAAAQIEKGVEDFEKGNMRLSIALSLVK